jgi:regulatory subunit for Cdc7p protein kinase
VAAAGGKQKRSYATIQREEPYGQQPPAKKQMVKPNPPSAQVTTSANVNDGRVFTRKSTTTQPTSFTRKLEAVRGKSAQQPQVQLDTKTNEHAWETIRQWQRHYRKVFPKFVFYFESIPHDARLKFSKQVTALGAV